jgi:hypothetical protein
MIRSKQILITLFCTWCCSSALMAMDMLPYVNLHGKINTFSQARIKLILSSTNEANEACYSTSYRWGTKHTNAHTYTLTANGVSDYYGYYYLDMDIDGRFLSFLRKKIIDGKLNLASGMSVLDYRKTCQFKLKGLEFNADDTFLALRDKVHTLFQSIFNLNQGSTVSFPFNFKNKNHIRMEVNIL